MAKLFLEDDNSEKMNNTYFIFIQVPASTSA
jgi:hypothetical protein